MRRLAISASEVIRLERLTRKADEATKGWEP